MGKIPPYLLSLAGEYRVCSELIKRGLFATMTYGNRKSVDVYAINDRKQRAVKIEVKTTQAGRFVTSFFQKHLDRDRGAPAFWVLCQIQPGEDGKFKERFFVLTNNEIRKAQKARNDLYAKKFVKKHGKQPDLSTGVENLRLKDVEQYEDRWSTIVGLPNSGFVEDDKTE